MSWTFHLSQIFGISPGLTKHKFPDLDSMIEWLEKVADRTSPDGISLQSVVQRVSEIVTQNIPQRWKMWFENLSKIAFLGNVLLLTARKETEGNRRLKLSEFRSNLRT